MTSIASIFVLGFSGLAVAMPAATDQAHSERAPVPGEAVVSAVPGAAGAEGAEGATGAEGAAGATGAEGVARSGPVAGSGNVGVGTAPREPKMLVETESRTDIKKKSGGEGATRLLSAQERAEVRRAFNLDRGSIVRNQWPRRSFCNLGLGDLCLTIDGEVFTGYRMRSIAGERFGEFALDRTELGTNIWYRPNRTIDAGVAIRLEAIRSAGPQSLIGIDGDSLVIRLAQAYGHSALHFGPISVGVRGGMIPERWIEQVEKGYDTAGIGRLASEQHLLVERADLGGSLSVSGWRGRVELDLQIVNGEGRAQEELNRGKNTSAMVTVRPLRRDHERGAITLALHGAYRDGSWGVAATRAHRAAAAITFASPWGFAGAEFVQAFGVREQGGRISRSISAWASGYALEPYIGLLAKYDHVRQDLGLAGSNVNSVTAGLFSDVFGYAWRRRRRIRLYLAYQHEGYGTAAGPVPGAPQAAESHRFLLQIEAVGLLRAL